MRLLVDLDGVVMNFEKGFLDKYKKLNPEKPFVPLEERTSFYVRDQYPSEHRSAVEEIYFSKGFFLSLEPIDGAIDALQELLQKGNEVYICTSPLVGSNFCVPEKIDWVAENLGKNWVDKMVVTRDKTIIIGDILIDDNPEIKGIQKPSWEHVIYSQPYNAHVTSKRRLTWTNRKAVLGF